MARHRAERRWAVLALTLAITVITGCSESTLAVPSRAQVSPTAASTFVVRTVDRPAPGPIDFKVCFHNHSWQRPSLDEQVAYMTSEYRPARYGSGPGGLSPRLQESFEASFWRDVFSASGLFSMTDLSGLWTAKGAGIELTKAQSGACSLHVNQTLSLLNLWLLGYEALGAESDGSDKLIVRVRPTEAGFQVIQLDVAGGTGCCPGLAVDFIDASGTLIESIDSQSVWSMPP